MDLPKLNNHASRTHLEATPPTGGASSLRQRKESFAGLLAPQEAPAAQTAGSRNTPLTTSRETDRSNDQTQQVNRTSNEPENHPPAQRQSEDHDSATIDTPAVAGDGRQSQEKKEQVASPGTLGPEMVDAHAKQETAADAAGASTTPQLHSAITDQSVGSEEVSAASSVHAEHTESDTAQRAPADPPLAHTVDQQEAEPVAGDASGRPRDDLLKSSEGGQVAEQTQRSNAPDTDAAAELGAAGNRRRADATKRAAEPTKSESAARSENGRAPSQRRVPAASTAATDTTAASDSPATGGNAVMPRSNEHHANALKQQHAPADATNAKSTTPPQTLREGRRVARPGGVLGPAKGRAVPAAPHTLAGVMKGDGRGEESSSPRSPRSVGDSAGGDSPDSAGTAESSPREASLANRASERPLFKPVDRAESSPELSRTEQSRLVQRVARAIHVAPDRGGIIRLRLRPPELGAVQLEVRLERNGLNARLETETSAARNILLDHLSQLRDRLAEQGLRLDKFDVDISQQDQGTPGQQPGHADDSEGGFQHDTEPRNVDESIEDSQADPTAAHIIHPDNLNVVI